MPKPKGKKGKPQKQKESAGGQSEDIILPHAKIYVANLAGKDLDDTKFRELFQSCGDILSADLVTTSSQVFGFIEFSSVEEAQVAVETLNGQEGMIVKFAKISSPAPTAGQSKPSDRIEEVDEQDDPEDEDEDEKEAEVVPPPRAAAAQKMVFAPNARTKRDCTERPVEFLQQLVQKATRATSTSDCIVYTVTDADVGGFIATVELILPGVHTTHSGVPEQSKKEAKQSAARVAVFDPEVHRLLPPLQKEIREAKVTKAESSDDGDGDSSVDESEPERNAAPAVVLSAKKQRQIAKAEQRAKRLEKRKAAKAAKASLASESGEEEEDSVAETDSDGKSSNDAKDGDSDTESDEEDDSSSDFSDDVDLAELEAKKAAVRAKLAAKKARKKPALNVGVQAVMAETKAKARNAKVSEVVDFKDAEKVKDTRLQANYGQTKFIKP